MKYTFSYTDPSTHYVNISFEADNIKEEKVLLQFPGWRPGRYQMGNFVANVQRLVAFDAEKNPIECIKIAKDQWIIDTSGTNSILVQYNYYANELNGGSTYLDQRQLYVNPVNCCVYLPDRMDEPVEVEISVPGDYQVASSMKGKGGDYHVDDYHELADSPFIASAGLIHEDFEDSGVKFHLWFTEPAKPDLQRIVKDFKKFTRAQIDAFGSFPVDEYHYLIQVTPYKLYHGVEHQKSTVLALGPAYDFMGDLYTEFLGVSSHELYHTWNVKAIRPAEMFPYDYSKENYTRLGYVAEGVTTYMGDVFLFRSKVFDFDQYAKELGVYLQRHFDNFGRLNHSVAESSFDTWVDGYQVGAPGKKVSIYVEGCLLAFITDTMIMKHTGNKKGLQEALRKLYEEFGKKNRGYTEEDYQRVVNEVAGTDLSEVFQTYYYGTGPFEGLLSEACDYLGLALTKSESESYAERKVGIKLLNGKVRIIAPGSPAQMAGLSIGDKIVGVNGYHVDGDLDKWLEFFSDEDEVEVAVRSNGRMENRLIPIVDGTYFRQYGVKRVEETSKAQREAFNMWSWAKK